MDYDCPYQEAQTKCFLFLCGGVKVLCVYRLLGGIFVWVAAFLWTSYDASHARRAAISPWLSPWLIL
ncbi:MAG: hypothetical protein IJW50_10790, partial [Clostridia bacterium]|nr:hypothetical protein [Clostridia bacterium]